MKKQSNGSGRRTPDQSNVPKPKPMGNEELGEGNRTAAKRYNAGLQRTMKEKDIDALAEEAKRALEGSEGRDLRAAEEKAKRGPGTAPKGRRSN